jgi:hypothetical protein
MSATFNGCYSRRGVALARACIRKVDSIVTRACALWFGFIIVLLQVLLKCGLFHHVCKTFAQSGISLFARAILPLHPKARIEGNIQSIKVSNQYI